MAGEALQALLLFTGDDRVRRMPSDDIVAFGADITCLHIFVTVVLLLASNRFGLLLSPKLSGQHLQNAFSRET